MLLIAGDPGITPQFVDSTSTAVAMRLPQKNDFASCEEGASEKLLKKQVPPLSCTGAFYDRGIHYVPKYSDILYININPNGHYISGHANRPFCPTIVFLP